MPSILIRPGDPDRDFAQVAAMFTILENQPNSESGVREYYEEQKERTFQRVAEDEQGELAGFYWAIRDPVDLARVQLDLFVGPERRRQGVGGRLYFDALRLLRQAGVRTLRASVWDNCPEDLAFAERRGLIRRGHSIAMELDLGSFDDRPFDAIIDRLKGEGMAFTSMAELGNTEDAQRRLYELNDTAASTTPGSEGEHFWASFEDFRQRVCQSGWYDPAGQRVAIDTATGTWAAMSAITRFEGRDEAYNLFTGVDMAYRGHKLAQAVKVLALRYARDSLGVRTVRTHHNALNLPMIAIDRKLGYHQIPGLYQMEKILEAEE